MKKSVLCKSLALLTAAALIGTGCSGQGSSSSSGSNGQSGSGAVTEGPHGIKYAADQTLHIVYSSEAATLHPYSGDNTAASWTATSNLVEGLQANDQYGNFVPGLAESYEVSDDELVYTYHIRKGVHWVDWEGKEKAELTAHDFVTAAQYVCNPDHASGAASYYQDKVKGATALLSSETTDMSTLGFVALDDYTVQITLEKPVPYFYGYGGHFIPMCTSLYEELRDSYGMDHESLYYIGPYRLTSFDPQSERVYEKNYSYWDADNVHIETIVMTYNAEAATLAPEMFKRGEIDVASIGTDILSEWMNNEETSAILIPGEPDSTYEYYYSFSYVPAFDEQYDPDTWTLAIDNENFRQSLYWGLDRLRAKTATEPYDPEMFLTNTITPVGWCVIDNTDYTGVAPISEITARENHAFDEAKALDYKEKAMEELTAQGVKFPVTVYMPYNPASAGWDMEVQIVKQQLTELLGSDYLNIVLEAGPATGFLADVRRTGKYGFMKLNNGASDFDPEAWTPAFAEGNSWTFFDQAVGPNAQALAKEYLELLNAAKAITSNSIERYEAFAKAEKFLIDHALVIPFCSDSSGYTVTKLNPFEGIHNADGRYKYYRVLEEPLTKEQYEALRVDWEAARQASLSAK